MFVVLSSFLFFFFKQKTAYEMRISDWSSDVCSSDLIPNENLMTQEVENWSYSDRNVRVRIPVRVSYKSDLERAQALMMRAAVESPRTLDSPKPNVRLTAFGDSRSEEHTSELQSLMRISYAVFCLKKQNNPIKLHHHT